jgi:hypothetical protein
MTPTLGLTAYHPNKADHGYTLFAPMTGTNAYPVAHYPHFFGFSTFSGN